MCLNVQYYYEAVDVCRKLDVANLNSSSIYMLAVASKYGFYIIQRNLSWCTLSTALISCSYTLSLPTGMVICGRVCPMPLRLKTTHIQFMILYNRILPYPSWYEYYSRFPMNN